MAMTPMGQYPYTGAPMYSAPYQAANRTYPTQYQPQVGYSYISPQANQAAAHSGDVSHQQLLLLTFVF